MTTDAPSSFEEDSMSKMYGYDMSAEAARRAYELVGIGAEDIDVVERTAASRPTRW